jgi:hypothetical protein
MAARDVADGAEPLIMQEGNEPTKKMIAGKYQFVYCSFIDLGIGWFEVSDDGKFLGGDSGGAVYKGTAKEDADRWITLDLSMEIPAGITLVEGSSAQDAPHGRGLHAYLPPMFGDGSPQEMQGGGGGTVTMMVKRMRDDFQPPPLGTKLSDLMALANKAR